MRRKRGLFTLCLSALAFFGYLTAPAAYAKDDEAAQVLSHPLKKFSDQEIKQAFAQKLEKTPQALPDIVTRPDEELLILSLVLGQEILTEALLVYEDREAGKYFVPLEDFLQALEFPIDVDPDNATAQGWFVEESRIFKLNVAAGTANIEGREYTLSADAIERHQDGLYVSLEQLQKWFPLTLEVNFTALSVNVKTLEPLPIELRMARDERRKNIQKGSVRKKKQYPLQETHAPLFSFPFINFNTQSSYNTSDALEKSVFSNGTMLATGIFMGQDAEISTNASTIGSQRYDIRATLGRQDPNADLFGLGLSQYELGDINTNPVPLLARGSAGRGVSLTNSGNNSTAGQSGEVQLRGELPVGHQVDVMRNGQLLEFQDEPDENGEYVFDVDVFPGLNVFELVFYGPEGQKDVKEQRIYIPPGAIKKGTLHYAVQAIQDNTNLFTDRNSQDEDTGERRLNATFEYGLTQTSSLFAALSDMSLDGDRQRYGLLRYNHSFGGLRTDTTFSRSSQGGKAGSVRLQSVFRGMNWQLQHDYFDDFTSEETQSAGLNGALEHVTNIKLSGLLPAFKNIPLTFNLDRLSNKEGIEQINWRSRVTKNIKKLRITTEIDQKIEDKRERETDLNMQMSSRFDNINLRGNFGYTLEPETVLNNVSFTADWNINKQSNLRAALQRSGADDPIHTLTLGGSYAFETVRLGMTASYNDENEFRALLTSSFSMGYDPYKNRPFIQSNRLADTALFAPRVYYDKNNNNIYDQEDEWLAGVAFKGSAQNREARTDAQGRAVLTGISPYERSTLELKDTTLPDTYMRPTVLAQDYILRPSQILQTEFPVIYVGEIDGQIYNVRFGQVRNAQSIKVKVISPEQETIAAAASEFDGFFLVQDIPVGQYTVQPDPEQIESLGYCMPESQKTLIRAQEPFVAIEDIVLWPKAEEGQANIILGCHHSKSEMNRFWEKIKTDLKEELRKFHDNGNTKYVFGIEPRPDHYDLVLHDLNRKDAEQICANLKAKGIPCKPVKAQGFCPQRVIQLSRIDYGVIDNPE